MSDPADQELRALWQATAGGGPEPAPAPAEIAALARAHRSRLLRRNLREYVGAGLGVCVFAVYAVVFPPFLCKLGAILVCAACVLIAAILARHGHPRDPGRGDADMPENCLAFYAGELRRQRDLLRWVWLWYVTPFLPGLILFILGLAQIVPPSRRIHVYSIFAIVAAVCGGIIWLNLRAARRIDAKLQALNTQNGDR